MLDLSTKTPAPKMPKNDRGLGFVAVYFNIAGFTKLRENFERFIKRFSWLGDNLLIVELAYYERDFEMTGKHTNMVQLRSNSVMWQKEALINVGTKELREQGCKYVGWLDGDAIIENDNQEWYNKIKDTLKEYSLVQVCERINCVFDDWTSQKYTSMAEYTLTDTNVWHCYTAGLGWAMHGDLWDNCHYYDKAILGAGDCLNFVGAIPDVIDFHKYIGFFGDGSKDHLPTYLNWASKWRKQINGSVSFVPGISASIEPHGGKTGRAYRERAEGLIQLRFNPRKHVAHNTNGALEWTELASPELKFFVLDYFINRKEDGE